MGSRSELVDVKAKVVAESENSFKIDDGTIKTWVPKSEVEVDADSGSVTMPEWLAIDRGLV